MTSGVVAELLLLHLLYSLSFTMSQPFIGVNYGEVADNLPPAAATAKLLQTTTISKLRLYGVDPPLINALAGTNVSIMIGTSNGDIASLAADPSAAASWVAANVAVFVPASTIETISVGNEVIFSNDATLISQLVPAMKNLRAALDAQPVTTSIKVTTVNAMSVLQQSSPPSAGTFNPSYLDALTPMLTFLNQTSSPFMINPYPYFAYQSDPRPETLSFCLFQPNPGRFDPGSKITYTNMFDAQVDAVRAALKAAGFSTVKVVVAETGWPYLGGATELGATIDNAKAYNGNLVAHLRALAGSAVETYLFELYDENLKGGAESEKHFGLYRPDGTMNYDVGLLRVGGGASPLTASPSPSPSPSEPETTCTSSAACKGSPGSAPSPSGAACTTCEQVHPISHPPMSSSLSTHCRPSMVFVLLMGMAFILMGI